MSIRTLSPFAALALGALLLTLNAQTVKRTVVKPTSPASGKQMFTEYCATCHGIDGKGNGPAAVALKTPPPDLTMLTQHNGGKFPANKVFEVIKGDNASPAHGNKDMPIWGDVFTAMSHGTSTEVQQRISNLTGYVEGIQAK